MKLVIENVNKQYDSKTFGLRDFSLELGTGVIGLLGPNGAGKSTLMRILATWLAGVIVAIVAGSGVALNLVRHGDGIGLAAWSAGALFIPALALALSVWSGSNRLFEVVYLSWWYMGALNRVPGLDYLGASAEPMSLVYLVLTGGLPILGFVGRQRQLQMR